MGWLGDSSHRGQGHSLGLNGGGAAAAVPPEPRLNRDQIVYCLGIVRLTGRENIIGEGE